MTKIARAVLKTGFRGWFSYVFDGINAGMLSYAETAANCQWLNLNYSKYGDGAVSEPPFGGFSFKYLCLLVIQWGF